MERRFTDAFLETQTRKQLQKLCKSNGLYGKGSNMALKASLKELMGTGHDNQASKITMPSKRPDKASKKAGGRRGVRAQAKGHNDAEPQDWPMEDVSPFERGMKALFNAAQGVQECAVCAQDAMDIDVSAECATKASTSERVVAAPLPAQAMSAHDEDSVSDVDVSAEPATKASNSERVLQASPSAQGAITDKSSPAHENVGDVMLAFAGSSRVAQQLPPSSNSDSHIPSATSPTLPTPSHVGAATGSVHVAADDISPQTEELAAGADLHPVQHPSPSNNNSAGPDDPAHATEELAVGADDLHLPSVAGPLPSPKKNNPKTKTIANARERANPMSTARRPIRAPVNALQFDAGHYDASAESEVAILLSGLADMRRTGTPSLTAERSPAPEEQGPTAPSPPPEDQDQEQQAPAATRATRKSPRNHPTPTPPAGKKTRSEGPESPPTESQPAAALFPRKAKTNTAFDALLQVAVAAGPSEGKKTTTDKGKTTSKGTKTSKGKGTKPSKEKGKKPTKAELAVAKKRKGVVAQKGKGRAATPAPPPRGRACTPAPAPRACTPFPGDLMDEDEDTESEDSDDDGMEVDYRRQRPGWRALTPQPDDRRSPSPDSESDESEEEEEYEYYRAPTPELIPYSPSRSPSPIPSCSTRIYPVTQSSRFALTTKRRDKTCREDLGDRWLYTKEDEEEYKYWAPTALDPQRPRLGAPQGKGKGRAPPRRCLNFPAKKEGLEMCAEYIKRPWEHWSVEEWEEWEAMGLELVVESDEVRRL